jgi:hypothetical protein
VSDTKKPISIKLSFLRAVMADPGLSAPAKCVMSVLVLTYHNDKTGRCNPSLSRIAASVGLKRRATIYIKVWNTSVLRQFVKYAGLNSREADDTWNEKFEAVYGADRSDSRFARFQDYIVEFMEACTQDIPLFAKLARLAADDMSQVPKIRASSGGQILMTAPGMNILGALAHTIYHSVHKRGDDIRAWTKKLGNIDWSYEGELWQPYLLADKKVSTNAKAVKDTVEHVEKKIGLAALVKSREDGIAA